MGAHLCKLAAMRGDEVTVTTRRTLPSQENVRYLTGDAKDIGFLKRVLSTHWDCVVDFMVYSTEAFRERMPILLGNTHQYLFLSSARVYAESNEPLVETSPRLLDVCQDAEYLKTDEYALAKARQEDLLAESGAKNWTIIRPYITYAEERLQLGVFEKEGWLYRLLQGRPVVFCKDIAQKETTLTYGLDVAEAICGLLGKSKALGEAYHITSNYTRTWQEIWNSYESTIQAELGIDPKIEFIEIEKLHEIYHGRYQIVYDRLFNRTFDNNKILSVIGETSFLDPEEGLNCCLKKFLCHKKFNHRNIKSEALKDRVTMTQAKLSEFKTIRQKANYLLYRHGLKT